MSEHTLDGAARPVNPSIILTIHESAAAVPLVNGGFSVIDLRDWPDVTQHAWSRSTDGYAVRFVYETSPGVGPAHGRRRHKVIRMHREIVGAPKGVEIDHRDGRRLNNRRSNLRPASRREQLHNAALRSDNNSGVKGVCWDGTYWRAYIRFGGKQQVIGKFDRLDAAVACRRAVAKFIQGDFYKENA